VGTRLLTAILLTVTMLLAACGAAATPTSAPAPAPASGGGATAASAAPRASATSAKAAFPLEITDGTGAIFKFDRAPKIGCWWYGCTEMMADLGLVPHAAGVTEEELNKPFYFPAGKPAHRIADINNPEQWAAAGVDVIIARTPSSPNSEGLKVAAPVFYMHAFSATKLRGADEFILNTRLMGQLAGAPDRAEAAIARYEAALATVKKAAPPGASGTTIAVLFAGEGYRLLSADQPFCDIIGKNGLGKCLPEAAPGGTSTIEMNAEEFLRLNPGWIAYQTFAGTPGPETRADPVWQQLGAVKAGQVYKAGTRYYCCSLRGLIHSLQEYAAYTFGPAASIPKPGPVPDFDPLKSPLLGSR
jgi:ABC-type Fe3+-hydroxamate transport system substrate-binding protein